MGIEINIQVVLHHAAALVLYGIDDAVDAEPCSQGELVQISRDGVVFFWDRAGVGVQMAAAAGFTAAVGGDLKGSIGLAGNGEMERNRAAAAMAV